MSEYKEENSEEEEGSQLIPQLGSGTNKILGGSYDMRLLTVLRDPTEIPTSFRPMLYALTRTDVTVHRKPFWGSLTDNALHLYVGVDGRGRRDLIRGEQVSKGGAVSVESEIKEPGFIQKYITRRNWEEEERKKLGLE